MSNLRRLLCRLALLSSVSPLMPAARAQTIRVDAAPEHSTNSFIPTQALGAGIDRMPAAAVEKYFSQPPLDAILAAGWQPVTYRQNTELAIEAWHWNPNGTWSDPTGKGYFTGLTTPAEPIRHSYGYPLPHRGFTRNEVSPSITSRLPGTRPDRHRFAGGRLSRRAADRDGLRFLGESDPRDWSQAAEGRRVRLLHVRRLRHRDAAPEQEGRNRR